MPLADGPGFLYPHEACAWALVARLHHRGSRLPPGCIAARAVGWSRPSPAGFAVVGDPTLLCEHHAVCGCTRHEPPGAAHLLNCRPLARGGAARSRSIHCHHNLHRQGPAARIRRCTQRRGRSAAHVGLPLAAPPALGGGLGPECLRPLRAPRHVRLQGQARRGLAQRRRLRRGWLPSGAALRLRAGTRYQPLRPRRPGAAAPGSAAGAG
mmetsp:Transcript_27997/g.76993  ORF Transcript_27997/g.76993 Transcript_27997/m.76993 type:complete len:210 (+) Transcript_27997:684-1313(+)